MNIDFNRLKIDFMKKILLALTILSTISFTQADAQKSKFDKNYPVCRKGNGYGVCCQNQSPVSNMPTVTRSSDETLVSQSLRRQDTYVHMGYSRRLYSNRHNPRILVSVDDPAAPYKGEDSRVNDGVHANIERNINYLDNTIILPPNDGGISDR